jgi:hypothetical protein
MPSSAQHPLPFLKSFTAFYAEQDGSQTWKQLILTMIDWLHSRRTETFTEQTLLNALQKLRKRVISLRGKKKEVKRVVTDYEELRERMANTRMPASRRADYERRNAHIIEAYNERKEIKESKWDAEEERMVQGMDELVVRRRERREEKERREAEDKQARKRKARDEKEERLAKKRKEKDDKHAAEEQKLRDAEAKRAKLRDQRASQLFELKQAQLDKRRLGAEDLKLDRKLKRETLSVLKSIGNVFRAREREMGIAEEEEEEEELEQENTDPSEE